MESGPNRTSRTGQRPKWRKLIPTNISAITSSKVTRSTDTTLNHIEGINRINGQIRGQYTKVIVFSLKYAVVSVLSIGCKVKNKFCTLRFSLAVSGYEYNSQRGSKLTITMSMVQRLWKCFNVTAARFRLTFQQQ